MNSNKSKRNIILLIVVAALGYFVDIYDLILFNIVKKESLKDLGFNPKLDTLMFNWQMFGMLLGGLLWGIWGDKRGRVTVLFGSILIYSIANICNAFATSVEGYATWRFIAGIGLAGELGAAITLVAENMSTKRRGIGTMIIVTFGALGAVLAFWVSKNGLFLQNLFQKISGKQLALWQVTYIFGGLMGLLLLALRAGTFESGMFHEAKKAEVKRGDFFMLFKNKTNIKKYLACIAIGIPVWFVVGILVNLCDRFVPETGVTGNVIGKECVLFSYIGLSLGDLFSGLLSQLLKSRKKVIYINLSGILIIGLIMLYRHGFTANEFKMICLLLGAFTGYWALFVTNASEQFGTNLRSTVAATVPNFVRGTVVILSSSFVFLADHVFNLSATPHINSALIVGGISLLLAFISTWYMPESFHKDLNYFEE